MLHYIYSTLEHWWTCCKHKSLTMQKLPSPYAGCKKQAFREGSSILFCASQTTFGEHLFILRLVRFLQGAFFSTFWMLLKWIFPPPWSSLSSPHFLLVEGAPEESAPGRFCTEKLLGRQDWNPKIAPCLEKETEKAGNVSNPLWAWTGFQNRLGGGSVTANTLPLSWCRLVRRLRRTDSLRWLQRLWRGHVLPPPGLGHSVPCDSTTGFEVTHAIRCQSSDWERNRVTNTQNPISLNYVEINRNIFWENIKTTVLLMPKQHLGGSFWNDFVSKYLRKTHTPTPPPEKKNQPRRQCHKCGTIATFQPIKGWRFSLRRWSGDDGICDFKARSAQQMGNNSLLPLFNLRKIFHFQGAKDAPSRH